MNRIDRKFAELREAGRKGFVAYFTGGDPDMAASEQNIRAAIENGVDVLELGVPFSDPTADGPTIQEAAQRALAAGASVTGLLGMVRSLRAAGTDVPIVLFGYVNPFFRYGYENLCRDAAAAGVDGLLVVDMPFEQRDELSVHADKYGIYMVPLIAPTTPPERMAMITGPAKGFVYYIMVTGVTGARDSVVADVAEHIGQLRACTDLPIAAGFGVSNGEQAAQAAAAADAVVVGSALVRAATAGREQLVELVRDIREGLRAKKKQAGSREGNCG